MNKEALTKSLEELLRNLDTINISYKLKAEIIAEQILKAEPINNVIYLVKRNSNDCI